MSATTIDYQKSHDWQAKHLHCHFRLSVVVVVVRNQFLRAGRGRNDRFAVGIVVLSVLVPECFDGHIAIPVVDHCRNHLATLYSGSLWSKIPDKPLEFRHCLSQFRWYNYFRLSFDVIDARTVRKTQVCRRNCSDICHTVGGISIPGLDGHIAVSGCPSTSHLFVYTLFEFGVVENFVYRSRITVILILQIYSVV